MNRDHNNYAELQMNYWGLERLVVENNSSLKSSPQVGRGLAQIRSLTICCEARRFTSFRATCERVWLLTSRGKCLYQAGMNTWEGEMSGLLSAAHTPSWLLGYWKVYDHLTQRIWGNGFMRLNLHGLGWIIESGCHIIHVLFSFSY